MTTFTPSYLNKIINPDLARAAMHRTQPHGSFKAIVRLAAKPRKKSSGPKILELDSPGFFKVCIPCSEMESFAEDKNVISIELREHITSSH